MKCSLPEYINRTSLPETEKDRLGEINVEVFSSLKKSKNFRTSEGRLLTKKHSLSEAQNYVASINTKYGAKIVRLDKVANKDFVVYVNVLPLAKQSTMLTPEHIANRQALLENEPYVTATIKLSSVSEEDENLVELKDAVFGPKPINTNPDIIQGKFFSKAGNYTSVSNEETVSKVKDLLKSLGVSLEISNNALIDYGAYGVADTINKLVTIANGKEGIALAEEAMHIISTLLPEDILKQMTDEVVDYQIYKDVVNQYKDNPYYQKDFKPDYDKLKLEAVGKLLAEYYIMKNEGLEPSEVYIAKTWWNRILDWIKSWFTNNKDIFNSTITSLNNGELVLLNQPNRNEILLNAQFTDENLNHLQNILLDSEAAPLLEKVNSIINRLSTSDAKIINKNLSFLTDVINRDVTSVYKKDLSKAAEETDPRLKIKNLTDYLNTTLKLSKTLYFQHKEITQKLDDVNTSIDDMKEAFSHFRYLEGIADILLQEARNLSTIVDKLNRNGKILPLNILRNVLAGIERDTKAIVDNYGDYVDKVFIPILNKSIEQKQKVWLDNKRKQRKVLEDRAAKYPSNKKITLELAALEEEMRVGLATASDILEMLKNPDRKYSVVSDLLMTWVDGDLNNAKQDVSVIANYMHSAMMESQRDALKDIQDLQSLFNEYGYNNFTSPDNTFSKFLQEIERIETDPEGNALPPKEDLVLIASDDQWKFDNDIASLDSQITKALMEGDDALAKNLKDQKRLLIKNYGEARYTEEFDRIHALLENVLDPETGELLNIREIRTEILEKINAKNAQILPEEDVEPILDEIELLWREFYRLDSMYYENGEVKTGRDKIIAEAITKWKAAKIQWGKDNGNQSFDVWKPTTANEIKWLKEKEEADEKFSAAQTLYNNDSTTEDNYNKIKKDRDLWYRLNTIQVVPKEAYQAREDIFKQIDSLIDAFQPQGLKLSLQDLWQDMFSLVRGYRDSDQTIIGSELTELTNAIKSKEEEMEALRNTISSSTHYPQSVKDEISSLFEQLKDIQVAVKTDYWNQAYQIRINDLIINNNLSPEESHSEIAKSKWFMDNTIDVTERLKYTEPTDYPETVYVLPNGTLRMVGYQWRKTQFNEQKFPTKAEMSTRWKRHSYNKKLINPNYETITGSVAVKKNSIEYSNTEYNRLSDRDKEFLEKYREIYNRLQKKFGKSLRLGDSIPAQQARGLERSIQRIVNAREVKLSSVFKGSSWANLAGLNKSDLEQEYGEGRQEDKLSPKADRVIVYAKMANRDTPANRRSKNLYALMVNYALEAHRYSKMWELKPFLERTLEAVSTAAAETTSKKERGRLISKRKQLEFSILKFVNNSKNMDTHGIARAANNIISRNLKWSAFFRLGLPYPTPIIKNQLSGTYQIMMSSALFKQFTEEDFKTAFLRAMTRAHDVYMGTISEDIKKYAAIARYFEAVPGFSIADTTKQLGSASLKAVDNFKYLLNYFRGTGETQMSLTMWEMFSKGFRVNGKTIDESFSYSNGKLEVTNPELTKEVQNHIRNTVANMTTFVQGNFYSDNAPLMKAFFWGKIISFMTNWFYPALIRRVGKKRVLSSGQEVEGAYYVLVNVIKQSPKLLLSKHLTIEEKSALRTLIYDWGVANAFGIAMYALNLSLRGDDDGDDEEQGDVDLANYSAVIAKKTYMELSYFNPVEKVGGPIKQTLYGASNSFKSRNKAMNAFNYFVTNPFINTVMPAVTPVDFRKMYFGHGERGLNHPWYKQYQDDILTLNLIKTVNFMPEPIYPKSALSGYNFYNPSLYDYIQTKDDEE